MEYEPVLYIYVTGGRSEGGLSWKDDQAACMATMAAKSRAIPIVFLVFCVVFAAAVDSDEVPVSFDVLLQLQPEKAARLRLLHSLHSRMLCSGVPWRLL